MTRVVRALYRSLLPLAVSLDHNPMLRLFGLPPGQQPPRFFTPTLTSSNSSTLSTLQLLRDCFRSPPPGMDESHAFTALRGVNAMRSKLAGLGDVGHSPKISLSSALFSAPSTHLHDWLPKGDGSSRGVPHSSMAPGTLLVSHPSLSPPFQHSVILLLATHPEEGCVGVVLNGGELPSTPATSSPNPQKDKEEQHQQRQPYPPSSPWVPALSFAPLSPPLHPTLLHSPGRVSPAQRHPYTNLHSLRYYASPHTQFTLSGGEIAVGALRAVGVHSLLHPSGLCAVVGGRFGVDHDNDSDDDGENGRGGRVEAAPRRTEGVLPIGPGLDAPAPPWIKKAAKAWLADPEHQHLLNYGHWQKQLLPQQSGSSTSPLPLNPTPPGGGISPLYGRIFSHFPLSQRRHKLRGLQKIPTIKQQQQGGGGGSGGGSGGGVGRWHGKQALKVSYAFTAGGGKHGVSAFDASPGASIGLRRGGVVVEKEEQDVEEEEEEEEEESVEGITMPPSLPSSLTLWGTDDDAEHFGDVTWGLGGGGGGGVGGNSNIHPGWGYGGGTTTTTSTIPTTFSSPAFFAPNSSPSTHATSFSSSLRPGVREDRDEEEGGDGEDEEDGLVAEDEDEDEEFELLVGLKKAGEEGEDDGSVGEGEDEDAFTSSSYSSNFSRRRLRRSSSGVVGGGGASGFFSRLSSPLTTFTSKGSSGGGSAGRGQREENHQQQPFLRQQQREGRWGGRHGRRSNVTLFPPSHYFSQSRGQLTHVIAQRLGGDDAVVTLPVFVTIPASLSRARAATLGGGGGSRVVEGALHYYPAGAQGAAPAVMCEGGARLLSLPHIRRLARAMHALKKGEGEEVAAAAAAPLASTKVDGDDQEGALLPSTPPSPSSFTYYSGVVSPSSTAAAAKLVGKQAALPPTPPVIRWGGPVDTVPFTLTRVDHQGELSGLSPMTTTVVQEMGEGETLLRGGRRRGGSGGGGFSSSSSSLKIALEGWVGEDGGGGDGEEGITIQPPILGRVGQMPPSRIRIQAGIGGGEKGGGAGLHVYSGLATWAPGQLESELSEGVWYTVQVEDVWGKGVVGGSSSEGVGRGLWESVLRAVGGWHARVADATTPPNSSS